MLPLVPSLQVFGTVSELDCAGRPSKTRRVSSRGTKRFVVMLLRRVSRALATCAPAEPSSNASLSRCVSPSSWRPGSSPQAAGWQASLPGICTTVADKCAHSCSCAVSPPNGHRQTRSSRRRDSGRSLWRTAARSDAKEPCCPREKRRACYLWVPTKQCGNETGLGGGCFGRSVRLDSCALVKK
jgi:hypothetical protein